MVFSGCLSVPPSKSHRFRFFRPNTQISLPRFSQLPRLTVLIFKPAEEPDKGNVHLVMSPDPPDPSLGRVSKGREIKELLPGGKSIFGILCFFAASILVAGPKM